MAWRWLRKSNSGTNNKQPTSIPTPTRCSFMFYCCPWGSHRIRISPSQMKEDKEPHPRYLRRTSSVEGEVLCVCCVSDDRLRTDRRAEEVHASCSRLLTSMTFNIGGMVSSTLEEWFVDILQENCCVHWGFPAYAKEIWSHLSHPISEWRGLTSQTVWTSCKKTFRWLKTHKKSTAGPDRTRHLQDVCVSDLHSTEHGQMH